MKQYSTNDEIVLVLPELKDRIKVSRPEFESMIEAWFSEPHGITLELIEFATAFHVTDEEVWLPIAGYEGLYEVSSLGKVRSMDRIDALGRERLGRELVPWIENGYRKVSLSKDGAVERVHVYRLVANAFIGRRGPGEEVCHNDGNPLNDSATNLRYDSHAGNMRDRWAHGTMLFGQDGTNARLTECDVLDILTLMRRGYRTSELAKKFKVHWQTIKDIEIGKTWAHLSDPEHPAYAGPPLHPHAPRRGRSRTEPAKGTSRPRPRAPAPSETLVAKICTIKGDRPMTTKKENRE